MSPKEDDVERLEQALQEPRLSESKFRELVDRVKTIRSMKK